MKKFCIGILAVILLALTVVGVVIERKPDSSEYLRIHIRANSNLEEDQNVKYKVKERVVEYLTPVLSECKTKEQAEKALTERLNVIEEISDDVLIKNGFTYGSKAKINNEEFPLRTYGELTLKSGYYDALIINLGSGEGDNWWCVVYPPLCFTGEGNYVYKSKIAEIIKDFNDKKINKEKK